MSAGKHSVVFAALLSVVAAVCLLVSPAQRSAAASGPVAAFSFDEGSGTAVSDTSGNLNNGTVSNAGWTAGKFGQALSFNGTSSLLTIPDSASLDLSTGMTVEAWVRPATTTGWRCVVLKESTSGLAYALYGENNANRPAAYINTGGSDIAGSGTTGLPVNTWSHIAATYDGASLKVYVNGTQAASKAVSGSIVQTSAPLRIGGNAIWGEYFSGVIDEVRLYNRALAASEIQTDMNTPVSGAVSISITAPQNGATISGTVGITASAASASGIAGVQFRIDGNNLGSEVTAAPYSVSWNTTTVADGPHTLTAVARNNAGQTATSQGVSVTVANTVLSIPTVSMTAPANGSTLSGSVTVSANASDPSGITGVQFLLDGNPLGAEVTAQPYSISWNTSTAADGTHALSARAKNTKGVSATSPVVNVTVANANPAISGQWSSVMTWPIVPVNTVLLYTGKVLAYDRPSAGTTAQVWDPASNTFTNVPNNFTDLFCSGHSALADGRILVIGGHGSSHAGTADVNIFDPATQSWTLASRMAYERWYPTATTLPDGRVLAFTGAAVTGTDYVPIPEVYNPASNAWSKLTGASATIPTYGQSFVLPNGKIGYPGNYEFPDNARVLDVNSQTWTTVDPTVTDGYSAMYEPGKVLKVGSSADSGTPGASANTAYILDFTAAAPAFQQISPMNYPRTHHNLTVLPDGNVLVTGGGTQKDGYYIQYAVYYPEMWSPVTKTFTIMAPHVKPRLYHSEALLLPDGRILVSGGGRDGPGIDQFNAEIYSPPYLFKGARPAITSTPSTITYGGSFFVGTPDAANVTSVALMRPGSVTHGLNMDQRYQKLSFQQVSGGLNVTAPANANLAPPGYYMLFLVNGNGVPSVASFLRIPLASTGTPPGAPASLTATGGVGTASLTWTASSSSSGIGNYNLHRSTTSGFTPAAQNRIAQPTTTGYTDTGLSAGTYYYLVTAEDVAHNISPPSPQASAVVTADTTPPAVTLTSPTNTSVSGVITLSANASDDVGVAAVQFLLDGANLGPEITAVPYAMSWNSGNVTNGTHTLAARARDTGGNNATSPAFTITVSNTALPGLVAAYSFSEGTGNTTADLSGNSNTGTISGASWSTAGKYGNALSFNGTNALVNIADSASLRLSGGMTLEAWVRPAALSNWRTILIKEDTSDLAYALYGNDNNNRTGVWIRESTTTDFITSTSQLPLNVWTHVAATYDGTTLRFYVNGAQVSSKTVSRPVNVTTRPLRIGGNTIWGEYFSGLIDDVRVYNRPLTAAEIQSDMATAVGP